jgi:hypothetical protein
MAVAEETPLNGPVATTLTRMMGVPKRPEAVSGVPNADLRAMWNQPAVVPPTRIPGVQVSGESFAEQPIESPRAQGPSQFSKSLETGGENVIGGIAGTLAEAIRVGERMPGKWYPSTPQTAAESKRSAQNLNKWAQALYEDAQRPEMQPQKGAGPWKYVQHVTGTTLPFMATALAGGYAAGPAGAFMVAASVEGDNAYRNAIASGAPEGTAQQERLIVGTLNGVIEQMQIGGLMKVGKASKPAIAAIVASAKDRALAKVAKHGVKLTEKHLVNAVNEGLEEALQESVSIGASTLHGDTIEVGDLSRLAQAGVGGFTAGGILGGAAMAVEGAMPVPTEGQPQAPAAPPVGERPPTGPISPAKTTEGITPQPPAPAIPVVETKVPTKVPKQPAAVMPAEPTIATEAKEVIEPAPAAGKEAEFLSKNEVDQLRKMGHGLAQILKMEVSAARLLIAQDNTRSQISARDALASMGPENDVENEIATAMDQGRSPVEAYRAYFADRGHLYGGDAKSERAANRIVSRINQAKDEMIKEAPRGPEKPAVPAEAAPVVAAGVPETAPAAQVERAIPESEAEGQPLYTRPHSGEEQYAINREEGISRYLELTGETYNPKTHVMAEKWNRVTSQFDKPFPISQETAQEWGWKISTPKPAEAVAAPKAAEEGKVATLYHGTDRQISTQDLRTSVPAYEGSLGEGIYFGQDRETAEFYGKNVHEVQVRIANPLVIDATEGTNYHVDPEAERMRDETGAYDSILQGEQIIPFDVQIAGEWVPIHNAADLASLVSRAKAAGHDALIVNGIRDNATVNEEVVVFNKNQVQSPAAPPAAEGVQTPAQSEEAKKETEHAAIMGHPKPSAPAPEGGKGTAGRMGSPWIVAQASAAKNFDQLKTLLEAKEGNEANRDQFTKETGITLPDSVAGTENTIGEFVAGRLKGGKQAGGTTIIPDMVVETVALAKDLAENPVRLVTATWEMLRRNMVSAATYMRTLGAPGKLIARDLDDITYRVTQRANNDRADIREVYKGMSYEQRELIAQVMNDRMPAKGQPKDILDRVVRLREVLDRSMREAAGLGMTRKVQGEKIPIGGKGKAYPQIPNRKGMRFLEEATAKGKSSSRVFTWAQGQVQDGNFKTIDDAVTALQKFRDTQLRGINRYLETSRVELPMDMIEWDGAKTLSILVERNWMTVEGVRKWGLDAGRYSFPRVNSRVEAIRTRHGADAAQRVKTFIQTSFGLQSPASRSAQQISNVIRGWQFVTKVGLSPITIIRNMTDRIAKGMMASPLSTLRASIEYPPFLNAVLPWARRFEDRMIRNGVVFGHGALSEGYEAGGFFKELANSPFAESERGNQTFIALVHYHKLMNDLAILNASPGRLVNAVKAVFGHAQFQAAERVGPKLLKKVNKGEEITQDDIHRFLHEMVSKRAFPMILNSKPIWYDAHPMMKLFAQFKTWPVRQTNMIWQDIVKYTLKTRDPTRLIGFVLGTIIAGEIYSIMRDLLFGKDQSVLSQVKKEPESRNVAKAVLTDLAYGGMWGLLSDLSYGIWDWAGGVSLKTGRNLIETAANIKKGGIDMAVPAIENLLSNEMTLYRQAKAALSRLDQVRDPDNVGSAYIQWRAKAWQWTEDHKAPTLLAKADAYTDDILFGKPKYEVTGNTLAYEMASRQAVDGDIEEAAAFVGHILKNSDDPAKALSAVMASMTRSSPLGPIAEKDRKAFLDSLSEEDHKQAVAAQEKYQANYLAAICRSLPDADLRKFRGKNVYQSYAKPSRQTGWRPHIPGHSIKGGEDLVKAIDGELARRAKETKK